MCLAAGHGAVDTWILITPCSTGVHKSPAATADKQMGFFNKTWALAETAGDLKRVATLDILSLLFLHLLFSYRE